MAQENMDETFKQELGKQFHDIVRRVIVTEKATRMIEFENKLVFEVDRKASKPMLKLLFENQFKKDVKAVNTVNSVKGIKLAIVSFKEEGVASDLSSELGLI